MSFSTGSFGAIFCRGSALLATRVRRGVVLLALLVSGLMILSACQPVHPVQEAGAAAAAQPASGVTVKVATSASLGPILVDDKGMTLYLFTKDQPNTSTCYDKCATAWPPLVVTDAPTAGDGADASKLGTTTRKDGAKQVTYNGWPLYYYQKDKNPGDTVGQDVGQVWYVLSPAGEEVEAKVSESPTPAAANAAPPTVKVATSASLGPILVDDKGMTLYLFTKDQPNTSTCYDKCATAWPPLVVTDAPTAGDGADASKLGATTRKDGAKQVTYNGWPLYYYQKDKNPGDTVGQDVGQVWYVLSPAGEEVAAKVSESPTPAAANAALPTVKVATKEGLGSFLVDSDGITLYMFTKDEPGVTNCYDKCAQAWPPLQVTDKPVAGEGVDASLLGTTLRKEGGTQVTYNGWPLYYYQKDNNPGDTVGQGVGEVWYVLSPAGEIIK